MGWVEESDIIDLEKRYWLLKAQSRTGRFDLETFGPLVSPPIRPSLSEVCFKVFDVDRDGVLSRVELKDMVVALLEVWKDNRTDDIPELHMALSDIVEDILNAHDTTKMGHLTLEDYQIWSVKNVLANEFLNLLFQVCHIVLGLRPATPEEEGQIIRGWLERESRYGLQPGHNWFIISMQWWQQWKEYVKYDANPVVIEPSSVLNGGKFSFGAAAHPMEQGEDRISFLYSGTPGADMCFARQHNTSDNNNQCLLGANGNILLHLNPQKPGAIDNQPLVTQEPVKVIKNSKTDIPELELFPRYLLFLRQQPATRTQQSNIWVNMGMMSLRMFPQHLPRGNLRCTQYCLYYEAGFLLAKLTETFPPLQNYLTLLDDEDHRLEYLKIQDEQHLVIEGHMAKCYGDLVQELWSGTQKNVAPLKLRWTIAKYAPRFNGFQQQDSQELLAFLLDGLHEDLNRVHEKPYVELKDSDGRPDWEVAAEAWDNHLRRNRSIVVDLFHGQLKSQVKCKTCGHISVRFDPFNFLSLPLPMDSYMHLEITDCSSSPSTNGLFTLTTNGDLPRPLFIPNGMPNTVVPCGTEKNVTNGMVNGHMPPLPDDPFTGYIIAVHRKMMRTELYFLSSQKNRPSLFGMPLIVPCTVHTRKKDLYDAVWIQVSRLASPLPPQEASNHAQDCDDSMGYQYPFTLRVVQKDGNSCAWCPWYR
ncbi:hypothetical protein A6R68_04147 [Neotoma lepida]|uniref:ubiquitinyl hydrolase 1 n=1 Tax=Neotoma lepida TaxID=56216 RepID=A0A1A6GM13_NEOLE|nr:hypothetical protein A6R68_04147 [Neotoma lepida]